GGDEPDVAEQLVSARGERGGGDVGAPVPGAIRIPEDVSPLAQLRRLRGGLQRGREELLCQPLRPAAGGAILLSQRRGEARDVASLGRHLDGSLAPAIDAAATHRAATPPRARER